MGFPAHAFLELEFFALILFSVIFPTGIYWFLFQRKAISRFAVLGLAMVLIVMAGIDVLLLQALADISRNTPSVLDDKFFVSGVSVALYLLPAIFAGIGVNLLSHVLIDQLHRAESRYDQQEKKRH